MIKGYDDHHERVAKGYPPYTVDGLINKINSMQDEYEAAVRETAQYRDGLTEILQMPWTGGVCPDDKDIIEQVRQLQADAIQNDIVIRAKMTCIDEQAKQIADQYESIQILCMDLDQRWLKTVKQNHELEGQIKSLQSALIKERFQAIWREGKHDDVAKVTELAKKQLRTEMPEEMA